MLTHVKLDSFVEGETRIGARLRLTKEQWRRCLNGEVVRCMVCRGRSENATLTLKAESDEEGITLRWEYADRSVRAVPLGNFVEREALDEGELILAEVAPRS